MVSALGIGNASVSDTGNVAAANLVNDSDTSFSFTTHSGFHGLGCFTLYVNTLYKFKTV
jgi:hypothetical protein